MTEKKMTIEEVIYSVIGGFASSEEALAQIKQIMLDKMGEDKEQINKMLKVLEYYANPEIYFAIGFLPDKPCGDFINDFSNTSLGCKPGKKARELLKRLKPSKKSVRE